MLGQTCTGRGLRAAERRAFNSRPNGCSGLSCRQQRPSSARQLLVVSAAAIAAPSPASSSSGQQRLSVAPSASSAHSQHVRQPLSAQELLDERLYEEIRACEAWADVLEVVQDEGSSMSTKRVVQALTRMGALLKFASQPERSDATASPEFQHLLQLLYAKLASLKASQACAVAMTLSQLHVRPPQAQLLQLLAALQAHAMQFSARDVATVMHASVALGVTRESGQALLDTLATRALQLLRPAAEASKADEGGEQDDTQASTSTSTTVPATQQKGQQGQQDAFAPQGLSMVMVAAAHLQYHNGPLFGAVAREVHKQLASFAPQGVSNVLWACGSLGLYFPELIKASLEYFAARRASFKAQEVSNMAWALTQLRHHPQQYSQALTAALLSQPEGALRPADVASVLQLLATFCVVPSKQSMGELCRRLDTLIPKCSSAELCNCLWALGLLGETARPQFARIAAALPARFERGELDDGLLRQAFQALLCATLRESSSLEQQQQQQQGSTAASSSSATPASSTASTIPSFPPLMLDTMKRLWVSTIQAGAARAARPTSPTKVVSDEIAKLRVRHDAARATRDGLVLIDVALRPSEERYVALQILRSFDHTRNTDQLLGPTQLERQILEKNGWEVKYLLYNDLQQVAPEAQLFFIAEYLRNIGCRIKKAVAAPGSSSKQAPAAVQTSRAAPSQAAREADVLLNDPRAAFRGAKGKRS